MRLGAVSALSRALLYEGYLLYPYRPSSVKNRHRWMFGSLYPRSFSEFENEGDPWWLQTECLVRGTWETELQICVRFLHLLEPEPVERQVETPVWPLGRVQDATDPVAFAFAGSEAHAALRGEIEAAAEPIGDAGFKITVRVRNLSPFVWRAGGDRDARREAARRCALSSTHAILAVGGGTFVSQADPPAAWRAAAAGCRNVGVWPVLVGDRSARDMMLASPIILDDYPRVADQSPGDFFDATEIDEMLTLRVLTLTDAEKTAARAAGAHGHEIVERTEALAETERGRLHGVARTLRPGLRVRLAPRPGGDVLDLALAGRIATIVTLEEDYEGRTFVAVTVDDDPGRDLGLDGRPGHRFFFRPEEVEVLS